ncbi:MAG: hypothetical protein ABF649_15445 [Bacillus sp. (in: firmicutes)]
MEKILNQIVSQLNSMDKRLGSMENKIDSLEGKFGSMENKMDSLEGKFGFMENKMDSSDKRLGSLEENQKMLIEEQREMRKEVGFYYGSMMNKLDETKTELSSEIKQVFTIQKQHQSVLEYLNEKQ